MSVVDSASTSPADIVLDRRPGLQEWALSRTSPQERAVAMELVLAHDFDEPSPAMATGTTRREAQSVREQILSDLVGIGAGHRASSVEAAAQRPPARTRAATAPRSRAGARRR
ncbi:MAG: hypothetical protein AVDCRST_MAG38-1923 [uncultured Solirubrobacteraceae bacterium]|uniref:Uncharacterized protein n=1 Tax=uncultured Solirubrobacteraceae bacterium TaxID=1162706 RepID=A0A6J4RR20_9ACTN|nr:MAG: hypothetical protein AVDCRST_MAG38-1923 [uncultured Solirubrobacteraceae bacterium]